MASKFIRTCQHNRGNAALGLRRCWCTPKTQGNSQQNRVHTFGPSTSIPGSCGYGTAAHRWTALTVLCNNQPGSKAPVKSCVCVCSGRGTVCVVWPLVPVTMQINGNRVDCWFTALQLGALQFLTPLVRRIKWTMGKQLRSFSVHKRQDQLSLAQIQNAGPLACAD